MWQRLKFGLVLVIVLPGARAHSQQTQAGHVPLANEQTAPAHPMRPRPSPLSADTGPPQGPHGGTVHFVGRIQVEAIVEPQGIRLFAWTGPGQPLDVRGARGVATLQLAGDAKRYRYDLLPEFGKKQSATSLAVAVDLRRIAGQAGHLAVQLVGIPGAERKPVQFTSRFVGPLTAEQRMAAAIAQQETCPVSGELLGSMGKPISVTVHGQTLYVCCAGCVAAVKNNPDQYFLPAATRPGSQQPIP